MQSSIQILRVSLLAAFGLLAAGTAAALQSDSEQPINITSATQEADLNKNIAIFTGDVVITQGSIEIHADRVEVYKAVPEKKQTTHIIAYGKPATFHQVQDDGKPVDALGKKLAYDVDRKVVDIVGDSTARSTPRTSPMDSRRGSSRPTARADQAAARPSASLLS